MYMGMNDTYFSAYEAGLYFKYSSLLKFAVSTC